MRTLVVPPRDQLRLPELLPTTEKLATHVTELQRSGIVG
jgi:hypothetical protein